MAILYYIAFANIDIIQLGLFQYLIKTSGNITLVFLIQNIDSIKIFVLRKLIFFNNKNRTCNTFLITCNLIRILRDTNSEYILLTFIA